MGEILLAYDGTEQSQKALDKSVSIMKPDDELILLYVIPAGIEEISSKPLAQTIDDAHACVNDMIGNLREKNIHAVGIIKQGDIVDEILRISEDVGCSLIVIGGEGFTNIGGFRLSSIAESVTKKSKCPVLVVK